MRRILSGAIALAAVVISAVNAQAASGYPSRPIQVIVPFAGGSASDVVTRILLNRMSQDLGQNFVVENRPGAGGNTGTAAATRAIAAASSPAGIDSTPRTSASTPTRVATSPALPRRTATPTTSFVP